MTGHGDSDDQRCAFKCKRSPIRSHTIFPKQQQAIQGSPTGHMCLWSLGVAMGSHCNAYLLITCLRVCLLFVFYTSVLDTKILFRTFDYNVKLFTEFRFIHESHALVSNHGLVVQFSICDQSSAFKKGVVWPSCGQLWPQFSSQQNPLCATSKRVKDEK